MNGEDLQPNDAQDMSGRAIFETSAGLTARLGKLSLPNRAPIETPAFLGVTSRGSVPHLTPDNLKRYTPVSAVYAGLEDFVEKIESPIYQAPNGNSRRLHSFTALPSGVLTVLGPRRCPAVTTPVGNTVKTISVFTSTGFRNISVPEYAAAVASLQPDIVLPMADLPHTSKIPVSKKLIRMVEHTELWLDEFLKTLPNEAQAQAQTAKGTATSIFAPVLPVEYPIQWDYLRHLSEDVVDKFSGLAVYDATLLPELVNYPPLIPLPKLSMDPPQTPHDILLQISRGVDICILPFVNNASDAGVAFTFTFPSRENKEVVGVEPLGINMWSEEHSAAVTPLAPGCGCYTCTRHHRAYVRHLLNAKEMLGWNLLQMHNHHVIDVFFRGIRDSLRQGGEEAFEVERLRFLGSYERTLPEGTGARPRARGYHFKSEAASERINEPSWMDLNGSAKTGDTSIDSNA